MQATWEAPRQIKTLYEEWESWPASSGIYLVRVLKPIRRVGGVDPHGTIYVGQARNLRNRLWQFWYANHTASGFLWENPELASHIIGFRCRSTLSLGHALGNLFAKVAVRVARTRLASAERAVLYRYYQRFGEPPPLNLTLPGRWSRPPSAASLKWAEAGLRAA